MCATREIKDSKLKLQALKPICSFKEYTVLGLSLCAQIIITKQANRSNTSFCFQKDVVTWALLLILLRFETIRQGLNSLILPWMKYSMLWSKLPYIDGEERSAYRWILYKPRNFRFNLRVWSEPRERIPPFSCSSFIYVLIQIKKSFPFLKSHSNPLFGVGKNPFSKLRLDVFSTFVALCIFYVHVKYQRAATAIQIWLSQGCLHLVFLRSSTEHIIMTSIFRLSVS